MIQGRNVDIVGTDSQPFSAATANDPDAAQTSSDSVSHKLNSVVCSSSAHTDQGWI